MTDSVYQILNEFGLPTAFLVVMIYLFIRFTDNHKNERDEWREEAKESRKDFVEGQRETSRVLRDLVSSINSAVK